MADFAVFAVILIIP